MTTALTHSSRRGWYVALAVAVSLLVVGAVVLFTVPGLVRLGGSGQPSGTAAAPVDAPPAVELVEPNTLAVPKDVRDALGIKGTTPTRVPTGSQPLVMPGSTALDPTRIARVRTRFNAEVVEIGKTTEPGDESSGGKTITRELQNGDRVRKGEVLAVVWSVEVGAKKSDLFESIVQLRLDERRLKERLKLWKEGHIPEDTLNQTRRDVLTDRSAVERAERTLRVWNIPDNEIQTVREEAEKVAKKAVLGKLERDREKERLWARSELQAPRDGTIVERNIGVGEFVADTTTNLFTVADVSRMQVLVNPPEDDLPRLLALPYKDRVWTLRTVGLKPVTGRIDEIGYILDPNQHTAVVKGYIGNPDRSLRAGQFVSATVNLPPPADVAEVPITAVVEDGKQSFVFVQPDPDKHQYTLRRVVVTHRFDKVAWVCSKLTADKAAPTADEKARGVPAPQPLRPGEQVLTSGALELRAALEDLSFNEKK
jgi:cobalt-zinc-cadmium efflux system membrane fusion protein